MALTFDERDIMAVYLEDVRWLETVIPELKKKLSELGISKKRLDAVYAERLGDLQVGKGSVPNPVKVSPRPPEPCPPLILFESDVQLNTVEECERFLKSTKLPSPPVGYTTEEIRDAKELIDAVHMSQKDREDYCRLKEKADRLSAEIQEAGHGRSSFRTGHLNKELENVKKEVRSRFSQKLAPLQKYTDELNSVSIQISQVREHMDAIRHHEAIASAKYKADSERCDQQNAISEEAFRQALAEWDERIEEFTDVYRLSADEVTGVWDQVTEELESAQRMLADAYAQELIPAAFRNIRGVYYLYHCLMTAPQSFQEALIVSDPEPELLRAERMIADRRETVLQRRAQGGDVDRSLAGRSDADEDDSLSLMLAAMDMAITENAQACLDNIAFKSDIPVNRLLNAK